MLSDWNGLSVGIKDLKLNGDGETVMGFSPFKISVGAQMQLNMPSQRDREQKMK